MKKQLPFDDSDKNSILEFAKKLKGKTLKESCTENSLLHFYKPGKGNFGHILEKCYFNYEPNSDSEPDFLKVGLELKSSPLKKLKKSNGYKSKERLVLNIINFEKVVGQDFENSSFYVKNSNILLVFYLHEQNTDFINYQIKLVDEWIFPEMDLEIIKKDWLKINEKIMSGKAHELSEGDTFYLGACTKGATSKTTRKQPYSEIPAKQRAYSLKQGYVNHMIASIANEPNESYGKLIQSSIEAKRLTIEEVVNSKFNPFYGMNIEEIIQIIGVDFNKKAKNFFANLTKAILGIGPLNEIEEFDKAEIIVKTVRLKENDLPKEDISFPNFRYDKIVNEEWEESDFKNILEHKFLFIFFQIEGPKLILRKIKFWNMPYNDKKEAKRVWERTKEIVETGQIVNNIKMNIRHTNFPNKTFSSIAHVRPHATNSLDTYPLPVRDVVTQKDVYTKHCFWLNSSYVRDEIYLK